MHVITRRARAGHGAMHRGGDGQVWAPPASRTMRTGDDTAPVAPVVGAAALVLASADGKSIAPC